MMHPFLESSHAYTVQGKFSLGRFSGNVLQFFFDYLIDQVPKITPISLQFPAIMLVEAGYDVWMGNARGTAMSRDFVNQNPNMLSEIILDGINVPEYWQYSWQDIGEKDLPAFIDYVLNETKEPRVNYVGFSQGKVFPEMFGCRLTDSYFYDTHPRFLLQSQVPPYFLC